MKVKKTNCGLKTSEQLTEERRDTNNYAIKENGWLRILFLTGTIFLSGLLLYGFIDGQATVSVILAYGILIVFLGTCTLHLFIWRVKVDDEVIEHRSLLGKRCYNFSEITGGLYKENGTLEIYSGDRKILKFDENINAALFEYSLSQHKIPQETWMSFREKKCIIRPKENHYIIPGIFFLYLLFYSVILIADAKDAAFLFLLLSCIPGSIFLYFLTDKTVVRDGWLYRNGFLQKSCKIRLADITKMERKKMLFVEFLILYRDQKKIAKISARNRNVDWLQIKLADLKKDNKKRKSKK